MIQVKPDEVQRLVLLLSVRRKRCRKVSRHKRAGRGKRCLCVLPGESLMLVFDLLDPDQMRGGCDARSLSMMSRLMPSKYKDLHYVSPRPCAICAVPGPV